jgi:peptidoglycan LD-endopeptidase LytH
MAGLTGHRSGKLPACIIAAMHLITVFVAVGTAAIYLYFALRPGGTRQIQAIAWIRDPASRPDLVIPQGSQCGEAPFLFPTDGMVGFLWDDSFRPGHRHQGIDIFAGTDVGETPVVAAYPGYLTRLPDWKSSVIIRVPQDPLMPSREIWVYYTHMADRDGTSFISVEFPPGTSEKHVEGGKLLGYQGNYSGNPANPVGVHLHVSIVKSNGFGSFKNELDIENTYDPSPWFGLELNARANPGQIPLCGQP